MNVDVEQDVVALILAGDLQVLFNKVLSPMYIVLHPEDFNTRTMQASMKGTVSNMSMSGSNTLNDIKLLPSDPEISQTLSQIQSTINECQFTTNNPNLLIYLKRLTKRGGILRSNLMQDMETRYLSIKLLLKLIYTGMASGEIEVASKSLQLLNAITPLVSEKEDDENEPPVDDVKRIVKEWVNRDGVGEML